MRALGSFLLISVAAGWAVSAQEVANADGASVDWRAAETYSAAASEADPRDAIALVEGSAKAGETRWACSSCHGDKGQGTQNIPRLSGLAAGYLIKQLHDYKSGARHDANMGYVASTLTDDEMAALGAYYASQEVGPSAKASLGGDLERGRSLALAGDWSVALPSCFSCHGPLGWGVEDTFPAISGQHPAYTHAQLAAWKDGRRKNSPLGLMHSVATALSDQDMRAVSDYLATLPPPQSRDSAR